MECPFGRGVFADAQIANRIAVTIRELPSDGLVSQAFLYCYAIRAWHYFVDCSLHAMIMFSLVSVKSLCILFQATAILEKLTSGIDNDTEQNGQSGSNRGGHN